MARPRIARTAGAAASGLRSLVSAKRPVLKFVLLFGLCVAVFYGVTDLLWFRDHLFPSYLQLNASVSASILNVFGENASSTEYAVSTPRFQLQIYRGCDAIEPSALFAAAVIAFPAGVRRKVPGLLIGVATLLLLNLVRIVSLYYTGVHFPSAFETMHVEVWQPLFILIAISLWVAWALWTTARHTTTAPIDAAS